MYGNCAIHSTTTPPSTVGSPARSSRTSPTRGRFLHTDGSTHISARTINNPTRPRTGIFRHLCTSTNAWTSPSGLSVGPREENFARNKKSGTTVVCWRTSGKQTFFSLIDNPLTLIFFEDPLLQTESFLSSSLFLFRAHASGVV